MLPRGPCMKHIHSQSNRHIRFSLCTLCPLWLSILFFSIGSISRADAPTDAEKASKEMADGAKKFLDSLSPAQLDTAGFEFNDNERLNWHFIPKPRKGLTLK